MLNVFKSEEFGELRNVNIAGAEYFSAKDVAVKLGYKNTNDAIIRHCRGVVKHEVGYKTSDSPIVQKVTTNFITEGDVYRLIIKSKLPAAEKFEKWVFEEVLPSIRKNGVFISKEITPQQIKQASIYLDRKKSLNHLKSVDAEKLIAEYKLIKSCLPAKEVQEFNNNVLKILRKKELTKESNLLTVDLLKQQNRYTNKKLNKANKMLETLEQDIQKILPEAEEYTTINTYGFSVNAMYIPKVTEDGILTLKRSTKYNKWIKGFPLEEIPNVDKIDFNKRVNVWLEFDHLARFDCPNLHKSLIDTCCRHWNTDDGNVQLMRCVTRNIIERVEDARIYICIKQGED
jgi:prophage antirepressor-like protein